MPRRSAQLLLLGVLDSVTDLLEELAATPSLSSPPCSAVVARLCDAFEELLAAAENFLVVLETDNQLFTFASSSARTIRDPP